MNQCNKRKEINVFCDYCRYIFAIWYLFDISHCRLTWRSRKQPLDKTESIKWSTTEPPRCMYTYTYTYRYKLSQLPETPTKEIMIAAEEAVLTEALALLSSLQIFRRIPKCFNTPVWHFLSSSPEQKITYTCWPIQYFFFIYYFARQRPILGHCQEDSLNHLMLITEFLLFFDSKVTEYLIKLNF